MSSRGRKPPAASAATVRRLLALAKPEDRDALRRFLALPAAERARIQAEGAARMPYRFTVHADMLAALEPAAGPIARDMAEGMDEAAAEEARARDVARFRQAARVAERNEGMSERDALILAVYAGTTGPRMQRVRATKARLRQMGEAEAARLSVQSLARITQGAD